MKLKSFLIAGTAILMFTACGNKTANNKSGADSDSVKVKEQKELVADKELTSTAKYYADMVDAKSSYETLAKVDTLVTKDMSDIRKASNFVFYPFGGPDFLYPHTMFPDADVYFLLGLEPTGNILKRENEGKLVESYKKALAVYLRSSFFITSSMKNDISKTNVLDGTLPVISMLMAKDDCQIISIKFKNFAEGGKMVDAPNPADSAKIIEIQFFSNKTPKHLQTLYYCSGDVANNNINLDLQTYLNDNLPKYNVVTFLKAASYLMHKTHFSQIRDIVLKNSKAVIGDDSGIPYRFLRPYFDITIYGVYKHPIKPFDEDKNQKDLDSLYKSGAAKPLDFKIGYNTPSNWMVARKKQQ